MLRPPSVQVPYDDFSDRDPALVSLPEKATKAQRAERERLIRLARETGIEAQWEAVTKPGEKLTRFAMKPLKSEQFVELVTLLDRGTAPAQVSILAFKLALLDVAPLPDDAKVEHFDHPLYGRIATTKFLDELGYKAEEAARIAVEIGDRAFARARAHDPKA